MKKITNTLAACFCLAVLFSPLGLLFTPVNVEDLFVREMEKRSMEGWPQIGTWQDFFNVNTYQQFSLALRDRFPGRGHVIIKKNRLAYTLGERRFSQTDRGMEHWLFVRSGYYRPWESPTQIRHTLKMLEYFLRHREAGEPDWTFFIGPDKDEIYPEKLGPVFSRLAAWAGRRREILRNFYGDFQGPEIQDMREPYLTARRSLSEPVFFKLDTHHTNRGMLVLVQAVVDRFQPGLWDPAEVVLGEKTEKSSDLGPLAGLGPLREPEQKYGVRRRGVELIREEVAPDKDWKKPAHYLSRSATRRLIGGRTLLLHDSLLAEARPMLRQYFEDLTCMHYDDFILDNALDKEGRKQYDHIVMEVAARQATFVWGKLLRLLNARLLQDIALDSLVVQDEKKSVKIDRSAEGWQFSTRGMDMKLYLPKLSLPAEKDYLLRVDMVASCRSTCELFFRESSLQSFSNDDKIWEEVQAGQNYLNFPVSAAQLAAGLRFDPLSTSGKVLIHSLRVFKVEPGPEAETCDQVGEMEPLSQVQLWIHDTSLGGGESDYPKQSQPISGNRDLKMWREPQGLRLWVNGNDPMLFLPGKDFGETGDVIMSLEMEAPQETLCQVYYRRSLTEKYSEKQSLISQIHSGTNRLNFTLPAASINYGVRLDPACQNGVYLIRRLYMRKKAGWGLRTQKAPRAGFIYPYYPLASWSGENLARVQIGEGMKSQLTPQGLELKAETDHPTLLLPGIEAGTGDPVVVNLLVESNQQTECRMFYPGAEDPAFTEARSVPVKMQAGLNQMSFVLPAEVVRRGLRFDPARQPGTYRLRSVELGILGDGSGQEPLRLPRDWYENLPLSRLRELFTFGSSNTLLKWAPGEMTIDRTGAATRIAIPGRPAPVGSRYILHARIKSAGEATAAFYYFAAGQKAYNEGAGQMRTLLPGWNDLYFFIEVREANMDMRLDISPAGAYGSIGLMEIREFHGGKP
ncbi:MAG: hypothetical protein AB1439_12395 [candidate division FCPU426 bacterium]